MKIEGMYQLLFEMSSDGIVLHEFTTTSARGHFIAANDAMCRLLGYTTEEMSHLTPFDIMSPEETPHVPQDAEDLRRNGKILREIRLVASPSPAAGPERQSA